MTLSKKTFPVKIFLLALALRLLVVFAGRSLPIGLDDMFQYDMLARSLAAGDGYRWYAQEDLSLIKRFFPVEFVVEEEDPRGILTSFRAPGYSFFLSLMYRISGLEHRVLAARLSQAFLGAFLVPLTYALAGSLFPRREKIKYFSAWAVALYPFLLILPLGLASENLFIPLLIASAAALLRAGESHRTQDYVLAGALLGMTSLTRSVVSAFIPFAVLWAWLWAKDKKGAWLIPLCVLLFTAPWSLRNSLLHGRFVYVESNLGYNLHMGYHPDGTGTFKYGVSLELLPYLDDAVREQIGMEMALGFIGDDPGRLPSLVVQKAGHFFSLERREITYFYGNDFFGFIPFPWLLVLFLVFVLPFAVLASLAGVGLAFLEWKPPQVLAGFIVAAYLFPHLVIMSAARFHLALVPVIAVWAGFAWHSRGEIAAQARSPQARLRVILALLVLGLLWFNWGLELSRDAELLARLFGPYGNHLRISY